MKKQLDLPELSETERKRLTEITLYTLINHVYTTLGDTQYTSDFIEAICNASDANISVIKTVITHLRAFNSTIKPTKEEIALLLYRIDVPVSTITQMTNMTPNTIYNHLNTYFKSNNREFLPRIKEELFVHVEKFTALLKVILRYDEY